MKDEARGSIRTSAWGSTTARAGALVAAAAVVSIAAAGPAAAQGADETVYELGEVVVSATRDAGVESIGTVRVIGRDELEASGVTSLKEALDLVPGVHVRTGGAGTPRVDLRGFRTRHVVLLVDGIPVSDTHDGQFDPTTIPVEFIERIKVTTGGGSVLYGSGGNGGVINIVTRSGQRELSGTVAASVAEGGAHRGALTASGGTGKWQAFGSVTTQSRDTYPLSSDFDATGDDERENGDRERHVLFASARYQHSESTRAGLTVNAVAGEHGVPSVTNYSKSDPFSQKAKYDRQDDLSGYRVQAAVAHQIGGDTGLRGWAYLSQLDAEDNRYDDATYTTQDEKGASRDEVSTSIAGGSVQVRRQVTDTGLATIGLTVESHAWEAEGFEVGKNGPDPVDESADVRLVSAAFQYETWPMAGLAVAAGLGYSLQSRDDTDGDADFTGLAGASYQVAEATRLKASWARKVRFPSIRQLYDASSGNPELETERTTHFEVGVEQRLGADAMVQVDAFVIDAAEFIEKDGDGLYLNYEDLGLRGLELAGEARVAGAGCLRGSYAYLHTEDKSDGSEREELQYRPRHRVGLEGSYRFACGLLPHLSVLRVAGQYTYDNDKEPPLEQLAVDDYTVVDLRLRQEVLDGQVQAHVGVENLLDANYEQSYGLPQPGRTLSAGLRYAF